MDEVIEYAALYEFAKSEAPRMAKVGETWRPGTLDGVAFKRPGGPCRNWRDTFGEHASICDENGTEYCPYAVAKFWTFIPSPNTEGTAVGTFTIPPDGEMPGTQTTRAVPWKVGQRRVARFEGLSTVPPGTEFVVIRAGNPCDWLVRRCDNGAEWGFDEHWPNELLADAPQDVGVPEPAKPAPQPTRSCDRCGKHHSEPTAWSLCHRCNDIVDQGTATVPSALGQGVGKAQNPLPFSCTNTLESGYPCNRTDPHPAGWECRRVVEPKPIVYMVGAQEFATLEEMRHWTAHLAGEPTHEETDRRNANKRTERPSLPSPGPAERLWSGLGAGPHVWRVR